MPQPAPAFVTGHIEEARPFPGLRNPHLQTLIAAKLALSREPPSIPWLLPLADGDVLALAVSTPPAWQETAPTVVLLHGLCGCHRSPYMQRLTRKLVHHGVRAIRMNMRGCGAGKGLARAPYHSGRSADALAVLEAVQQQTPDSPTTLVGFSLGGNIVLKLAGELAAAGPGLLRQVIAVCPPVDLVACAQRFGQPSNRWYNWYFTRLLCADVAYRQARFPELQAVTLPKRLTLYEFDELYTAPQCGFRDALDYYQQCSAAPLLPRIAVPCRLLIAVDDPLIAADVLETLPLPANVQITRTRYGGHLGFLGRPGSTYGYRAMDSQLLAWILGETAPERRPPLASGE